MDIKKYSIIGIALVLVLLLGAGCATPQTPQISTTVPQSCPTSEPLSCPAAAALSVPVPNAWRETMSGYANIIFTFDPGDKCTMQIVSQAYSAEWAYEIVVNDQAYSNYMLSGLTLSPGTTIAEVQDWINKNPTSQDIPPGTKLKFYDVVNPMSKTFHGVSYTGDPIYFACHTQGPGGQKVINSFDLFTVPKN